MEEKSWIYHNLKTWVEMGDEEGEERGGGAVGWGRWGAKKGGPTARHQEGEGVRGRRGG